jgi:N-acetylglucosamine kinase-like BadF-type ATPase
MEAILALDGGASRTRCLAVNRAGQILAEAETGPSNHLHEREDAIKARFAEATGKVLQAASLTKNDVVCLSAGLAGIDYDGTGSEPMMALFRELGFQRCLIHGDTIAAHAGALGMQPGIVVIAGTGSAILGIDGAGRRVKTGGWGPVYGDEGSARYIAAAALRAAARAYDGLGPSTALLDAIAAALNITDFRTTIAVFYGPNARNPAFLAPVVSEVASTGDPVALALFDAAGDDLAEAVQSTALRLRLEHLPLLVSYQGGAAENCPLLLVSRMTNRLRERLPQARVVPPRATPAIGAYLLACRSLGWEGALA